MQEKLVCIIYTGCIIYLNIKFSISVIEFLTFLLVHPAFLLYKETWKKIGCHVNCCRIQKFSLQRMKSCKKCDLLSILLCYIKKRMSEKNSPNCQSRQVTFCVTSTFLLFLRDYCFMHDKCSKP